MEPAVLFLRPLHLPIKLVEELVAKEVVIRQIELSPGIPEAVIIALSREVQPLWMAELIAFEIEVPFTSKAVCDESY